MKEAKLANEDLSMTSPLGPEKQEGTLFTLFLLVGACQGALTEHTPPEGHTAAVFPRQSGGGPIYRVKAARQSDLENSGGYRNGWEP